MFQENYGSNRRLISVEPLLSTIIKRKLAHFAIRYESLHKVIMQGFVEGKRRQEQQRTNRMYNSIGQKAISVIFLKIHWTVRNEKKHV